MNAVLLIALCIGLLTTEVEAFALGVAARGRVYCTPAAATTAFSRASPLVASEDEDAPSDVGALEDDDEEEGALAADVAAASVPPSPPLTTKDELLAAVASSNGLEGGGSRSDEINELILTLSSSNPTEEPARSSLINGKWELAFSGSPGGAFFDVSPTRFLALALYSPPNPSILALGLSKLPGLSASLGAVTVTIQSPEAGQPRVTVDTSLLSALGTQPLALRANLSPRSAVTLREDFLEIEALGQTSLLPGPFAVSRTLFVAYLDADTLIVRDEAGAANVLRRASFPAAKGDYPKPIEVDDVDDDASPGASS